MASLSYGDVFAQDLARIASHLKAHEVEDTPGRIAEIFDALELLLRHPLIGRPAGGERRELVIGRGSRGYVARYRYDALDDMVLVLGLRSQREADFDER